ncbi:MAG: hypothetical protein Q8M83_03280 [bacterium]|nr:hypothetical protein [bacterium]
MSEILNTVHRHILKDAWQIIWKNKWLWVLGFFAAFWGNAGIFRVFNSLIDSFGRAKGAELGFWQRLQVAPGLNAWPSPWAVAIFIFIVAVLGFVVWITTASRGGLIQVVSDFKKEEKASGWQALRGGTENFWPILGLSLLGKIIGAALLVGLTALIFKFNLGVAWWLFPLYIVGFVLLAALLIMTSFIVVYALAYVMIGRMSFGKSLNRAIDLFIKNWLISLEMALIVYAISFLLGLGLVVAAMILAMPLLLILVILIFLGLPMAFWAVAIPGITVFALLFLAAGAAFTTFELTVWVLLFKRLTQGGALAKLVRVFHRKEVE